MMIRKTFILLVLASMVFVLQACSVSTYNARSSYSYTKTYANQPGVTIASSDDLVVLITRKNDSLKSLAKEHLGDANLDWVIADANHVDHIVPGIEIIIPKKTFNPVGVVRNGVQTIPILCYHRFDDGHGKMSVSTKKFRRQMKYLKENGYRVVSLRDAVDFFNGKRALPQRSVVITIDDGYRSNYTQAFPIFQEYNFPATIFLYTDFLGAPDALTSDQIREMYDSGLIDFQPHSKTHPNMALHHHNESDAAYQQRVKGEIDVPMQKIKHIIDTDIFSFAYPFGDTNELVISELKSRSYAVAATVQPGTNAAYATPFMLRRTMIFGDHSQREFVEALEVFDKRKLF